MEVKEDPTRAYHLVRLPVPSSIYLPSYTLYINQHDGVTGDHHHHRRLAASQLVIRGFIVVKLFLVPPTTKERPNDYHTIAAGQALHSTTTTVNTNSIFALTSGSRLIFRTALTIYVHRHITYLPGQMLKQWPLSSFFSFIYLLHAAAAANSDRKFI